MKEGRSHMKLCRMILSLLAICALLTSCASFKTPRSPEYRTCQNLEREITMTYNINGQTTNWQQKQQLMTLRSRFAKLNCYHVLHISQPGHKK